MPGNIGKQARGTLSQAMTGRSAPTSGSFGAKRHVRLRKRPPKKCEPVHIHGGFAFRSALPDHRHVNRMNLPRLIICVAAFSAAGDSIAQPSDLDARRGAFLTAYDSAVTNGRWPATDALLEGYPITAYIEAAALQHALASAGPEWAEADQNVVSFLAAQADRPVARRVRRAWLSSLANRSMSETLIREFDDTIASTSTTCHYLAARIADENVNDIDDAVLALWHTEARLPAVCEPVFRWGRATGLINQNAIATRVEGLLRNRSTAFARIIAAKLGEETRRRYNRWADLLDDPKRGFAELIDHPETSPGDDAIVDAWSRFSTNSPADAAALIDPLIDTLNADEPLASQITLQLALGLAWDRRPEALAYFASVPGQLLDDRALQWQARAAMWAGAWPVVADSIDAMSEASRASSAWRYWRARAAEAMGRAEVARAAYETLDGDDNFYSAVAAARLGGHYAPHATALNLDSTQRAEIANSPGFVRARELHAVGLGLDARREWNTAYSRLSATFRPAAAQLASEWQWDEMAVLTASQNEIYDDYAMLYPLRFQSEIQPAAAASGLPSALLNGLIRQESLFTTTAVSTARAIGLTQLQLDTARRAAARRDMPRPDRDDLFDPRTNAALGAAQLRALLDEFEQQLAPALAGYNAGYYAAARWMPDVPVDIDVWIENIPYNETRAYVRRILWHSLVYSWLATGQAQDAGAWLAPIRPLKP